MPFQQPWLHDLTIALAAPTAALGGADGQIRPVGAQGVLHADVRVLRQAELRLGGDEPAALSSRLDGADTAWFTGIARLLGDSGADPTVRVERVRHVTAGRVEEEIRIVSFAAEPVVTQAVLSVGADLSPIELVKSGRPPAGAPIEVSDSRQADMGAGRAAPVELRWGSDGVAASLRCEGAGVSVALTARGSAELTWPVRLAPREACVLRWSVQAQVHDAPAQRAPTDPVAGELWSAVLVECDDRQLPALAARSLDDLRALLMAPAGRPDDVFAAAGAPWFFTLFGRDSLWAARLMLPFGWRLAAGTLCALAAFQGTKNDAETMEAPGKIPHELRRSSSVHPDPAGDGAGMSLPPLYYGTVDATALWVCLLHDAWRAGMPQEQVQALLPSLQSALAWITEYADEDGDGFLEYLDCTGHGLSNQGWKDSHDSIRFRDGRIARGPVALCEAQGYAHEAAVHGADLLDAFGLDGAGRLRDWAGQLRERFRSQFWVNDATGSYPALALNGDKVPVDSLTSNIGHLLGTGLLSERESADVVDRLTSPGMNSGYGLRTMNQADGGYSPLSYHCGSVWPHDTAIAAWSMARAGYADRAITLISGLVSAATRFGWRLPELYSGDGQDACGPVPYPAACHPQAWAAAAIGAIVTCLTGLSADVPSGEVLLTPVTRQPFGALRVTGLAVGSQEFGVEIAADGAARLIGAPPWVKLGA